MDQPTVLRTTKIGNGFIKEDVLAYVDELNSKIYALEEECNDLREKLNAGGGASDETVKQYEAELSRLRGELGTTKNQLRAAQDELKNRPVIGSDGEAGVSAAELEEAKAQLAAANEKNDSLTTQVEAMKADVERLTEENASLRSDLSEAAAQAIGSGEDAAKVAQLQSQLDEANAEIQSLKGELEAKDMMLEEQSGLSNEADLAQITTLTAQISEKDAALAEAKSKIAELEAKIAEQEKRIEDLKSNDSMSAMGALFMQAQEMTSKATAEAKAAAEKITREAKEQAESIISEANAQAEQTITSANTQAEEVVTAANAQADTTIANANEQADATISSANAEAQRTLSDAKAQAVKTVADAEESVRAKLEDAERRSKMTTDTAVTVRSLLRSEIDAVAKKITEATAALKDLQDQTNMRMGEAKEVIAKARETVSDGDAVPTFASFDEVASHSFSKADDKKPANFEFNFEELAQGGGDGNDGWS
ncbi:MAG: hypothetical protein E7503_07530 [Ruminococcus sp.]|nr:hypothetical protein [Ruminococcus sp.]